MMKHIENCKENRKEIIEMLKALSLYISNVREALCAPYGLSAIQAIIVLDVYHNPNKCKVTDICKRLNKSTNTISPLINRLVEKKFLQKVRDEIDGRITYIQLTDKSKRITEQIQLDVSDFSWPMFDELSDEEFSVIYNSLKKLIKVTLE